MKTVPLRGKKAAGRVALVDDQDYDLVMQRTWYVRESVRPSGGIAGPYAMTHYSHPRETSQLMHTLITGWRRADHVNHDGLDNRRENLRPCTNSQNIMNSRQQTGRSSAFKGVHWHKGAGKWVARVTIDYQQRHLGTFTDEIEAARAYDAAARELFGPFACLNFPS